MTKLIAITGGMAAGKSTLLSEIRNYTDKNVAVLSVDDIIRSATDRPELLMAAADVFYPEGCAVYKPDNDNNIIFNYQEVIKYMLESKDNYIKWQRFWCNKVQSQWLELQAKNEYDLIISGINRGYNLGDDIVYSGTCGAIFEGARMGINGLAISSDIPNLMEAPNSLDGIWSYIQENELFKENKLYNVNIPPKTTGEIRITKQGGEYYCDTFIRAEGENMFVQTGYICQESGNDPRSDIISIRSGVISVTPLAKTRTEMSVFEKLTR